MGFAEGFSSGYGLMDSTINNQRNYQLKKQEMADAKIKQANADAMANKEYGLKEIAQNDARQHNADWNAVQNKSAIIEAARNEMIANNQAGQLAVQQGQLGVQQQGNELEGQRNAVAKSQAESIIKQNDIENKTKQLAIDQATRLEDAGNAFKALGAYKLPTGEYNIPNTREGYAKFSDLVKRATNQDMTTVARQAPEYSQATKTLQQAFLTHDGKPIDNQSNPNAINALNLVYDGQINTGIGEPTVKGTVIKKEASDILPVNVPPTESNPSGKVYTIGIKTTYRGADGNIYTDSTPSPMTQFRSNDKAADPNPRYFTDQQLFNSINAQSELLDTIATNPMVQQHVQRTMAENTPRSKDTKDTPANKELIKAEATDADGNTINQPAGVFDKVSGEFKPLNAQPTIANDVIANRTANAKKILESNNSTPAQRELAKEFLKTIGNK